MKWFLAVARPAHSADLPIGHTSKFLTCAMTACYFAMRQNALLVRKDQNIHEEADATIWDQAARYIWHKLCYGRKQCMCCAVEGEEKKLTGRIEKIQLESEAKPATKGGKSRSVPIAKKTAVSADTRQSKHAAKRNFPAPNLQMVQHAFQMLDPTGSGMLNPHALREVYLQPKRAKSCLEPIYERPGRQYTSKGKLNPNLAHYKPCSTNCIIWMSLWSLMIQSPAVSTVSKIFTKP